MCVQQNMLVKDALRLMMKHGYSQLPVVNRDGHYVGVISERVVEFMEKENVAPSGRWWAARAPGVAMTEVTIHGAALDKDPATVAGWYAGLVAADRG